MKKLACIVNAWDGEELLRGAIDTVRNDVDLFIVVYQDISNFGEFYVPQFDFSGIDNVIQVKYIPIIADGGLQNEIKKRNIGLEVAKENDCTHFFHMDVDEFYEDFAEAKKEFIESGHAGSVCPIYTYFKRPIWRLENLDGYFVPFIHELHLDSKVGRSSYPFYCDPTRVVNQSDVTKLSWPMHHFSWVRKDIERKARNSSAAAFGNKLKGLLDDYHSEELEAHPEGYVIKDMGGQKIKIVPDIFGLSPLFYIKNGKN